jgi:hypothetical protein
MMIKQANVMIYLTYYLLYRHANRRRLEKEGYERWVPNIVTPTDVVIVPLIPRLMILTKCCHAFGCWCFTLLQILR